MATRWISQMSDATLQQMTHRHKDGKVERNSNGAHRVEAEKSTVIDPNPALIEARISLEQCGRE
jgi:hypothetical protein